MGDTAIVLFVGALLLAAMAMGHRTGPVEDCDTAPPGLARRYLREMMASMGPYVLLLSASIRLLKRVDAQGLRVAFAIVPPLPIGFAVRAIVRRMRSLDERGSASNPGRSAWPPRACRCCTRPEACCSLRGRCRSRAGSR